MLNLFEIFMKNPCYSLKRANVTSKGSPFMGEVVEVTTNFCLLFFDIRKKKRPEERFF